jgi:hypothetical protein
MSERSKLLFIMLTICGTLCILGALIAAVCLYQMNAESLAAPAASYEREHKNTMFAIFGFGPPILTLLAGIGMVAFGVRTVLKDDSAYPAEKIS